MTKDELIQKAREAKEIYVFDASKDYPEPEMTLEKAGTGFLPLGDISVISGKAKSAKSYCVSIIVASLLGCTQFSINNNVYARILYVDTEQSKFNVARIQRRIHRMMGWHTNENIGRLTFITLRECNLPERWSYILGYVYDLKPNVLVIDGVADIIEDFNNIAMSASTICNMLALCSEMNLALLTVLHENKSKEDTNMKGHLGTLLLQKCAAAFHMKPDKGVYVVENTENRNKPVDEWSFAIDSDGMPTTSDARLAEIQEEKEAPKIQKHREIFEEVFSDGEPRILKKLMNDFREIQGGSESTFYNYLKYAKEKGIVKQSGVNYVLSDS